MSWLKSLFSVKIGLLAGGGWNVANKMPSRNLQATNKEQVRGWGELYVHKLKEIGLKMYNCGQGAECFKLVKKTLEEETHFVLNAYTVHTRAENAAPFESRMDTIVVLSTFNIFIDIFFTDIGYSFEK